MLTFFKRKTKTNPIKEKSMSNYFSEEYLQKLINEHKLVCACITQFTDRYKQYAASHGADAMTAAHTALRAQKVELELKIDVLQEFLRG